MSEWFVQVWFDESRQWNASLSSKTKVLFLLSFCLTTFSGFQASHCFGGGGDQLSNGNKSLWLGLKEFICISDMDSGQSLFRTNNMQLQGMMPPGRLSKVSKLRCQRKRIGVEAQTTLMKSPTMHS